MTDETTNHLSVNTSFRDAILFDDRMKLAEVLRNRHLSDGERLMLADYISGNYRRSHGNKSGPRIAPADQRNAVANYLEVIKTAPEGQSEAVAMEIYRTLGVGKSTFYGWLSEAKEAIEKFVNLGLTQEKAVEKFIDIVRSSETR